MWLNQSLFPRLLDDSVLLRDTGSVSLGTLRLRQICDAQGEAPFPFAESQQVSAESGEADMAANVPSGSEQ